MQTIKKRGKSNQKYLTTTALPKLSDSVLTPELLPSNLILHLRKMPDNSSSEIINNFENTNILKYDPQITTPDAYDPSDTTKFSYVEQSNKKNKIDEDTNPDSDKLCWWCCHPYDTISLRLPIRKNTDSQYECVGNFCSPQCTCAYIIDSGSRFGDKWKEYELLHQMIKVTEKITPAPKRELLKVFGGTLDIDEFRSDKQYNLIYPPMVSLKLLMDDIPCDKPVDEDSSSLFLSTATSSMKLNNINLDNIDTHIPEKSKKKKDQQKSISGSLDRFWGNIETLES